MTEKNFTDVLYVHRIDKLQTQTFLMGPQNTVIYNETSCTNYSRATVSPDLYPMDPLIKEKITKNGYSIGEIINAILQTSFDSELVQGTEVVGGVEALAWIGCNFNVTGDNSTGIQVAVFHSGNKDAKQPYSKDFKNPIVLSIHFSTFKSMFRLAPSWIWIIFKPILAGANNTYNMSSHSSVDISALDIVPETKKSAVTALPRGQYCDNLNLVDLPGSIPDRFGASIDFVNTKTKQIDNIEVCVFPTCSIYR